VRNTTIFFGLQTEKRLFSSTATRQSGPPNNNMKYSTVKDVLASFPHPILPSVEGEPDYQTIHATRKFLQANSRAIDIHLGGGTLGHLGLIVSDAAYSIIAPPTAKAPTFWVSPSAPGREPAETDGTVAKLSATRHLWEEDVLTYRTCTSIQQALKKQIIGVFEPMYLEILNDNMVTYGNITAVDLEINFEHMRRAWDPQQPVESLFKQIQDCADYSESGGVPIGPSQQINVGYAKIFATGQFMSACRRWNNKPAADKTWTHFKSHFAAAHRQNKQMKGGTAAHAGFHSANTTMTQTENHMAEATIGALENLATSTAADRGVVAALTQVNARLVKQLEETSSELRELRALHHQERRDRRFPRNGNATVNNYFCTHGYKEGRTHTSLTCTTRNPGHKTEATRTDNMVGSQANKE
jgi:hypothetical protein